MEAKQVPDLSEVTQQIVVQNSQVLAKVLYACTTQNHETASDAGGDTGWYDLPVFADLLFDQLVSENYIEIINDLELRATQPVRLEVQYSVQISKTSNNSRCESEIAIFYDFGNGYVEVEDCTRLCYNRQESQGTTTAANALRPVQMATGDKLKLAFRKADSVWGRVGIWARKASIYCKKI